MPGAARRASRLGLVVVLGASAALWLAPAAGAQVGLDDADVDIVDFRFDPDALEVEAGSVVSWVNRDGDAHTVTFLDGSVDSGTIAPSERFEAALTVPGEYEYRCTIHPTMRATVTVVDSDAPGEDEPAPGSPAAADEGEDPSDAPEDRDASADEAAAAADGSPPPGELGETGVSPEALLLVAGGLLLVGAAASWWHVRRGGAGVAMAGRRH